MALSACLEFSVPMMGFTAPTMAILAAVAVTAPHWMPTAPCMLLVDVMAARCTALTAPFMAPLTAFMAHFTAPLMVVMAPVHDSIDGVHGFDHGAHGSVHGSVDECRAQCLYGVLCSPDGSHGSPPTAAVAVTAAAAVSTAPHWMSTAPRTVLSGALLNFHWRWRTPTALGG